MKTQYSFLKCLILIISVFCFYQNGSSQSDINKTASNRAIKGITKSNGYNYKIVDGQITNDSILAVTRKFNSKGYRTETCVYKNGDLKTTYQFEYANDTLLISMKTYASDQKSFMTESVFKYDKHQRLVKQYDPDTENGPSLKTKNKYNKLGQQTRSTFKSMGRKIFDYKFKYNKAGSVSEKISCVPTKEKFIYEYDNQNRLTKEYKVFKNGDKSLMKYFEYTDSFTTTKHLLHDTRSWLGINGSTKLKYSDVLTSVKVKDINEQVHHETEYLNGELNGFRKYYYY